MWDLRHLLSAVVWPVALATLLAGTLASAAPHNSAAEPDGTCGLCVLAPSGTSLTSTGNGAFVVNAANIVVNSRGAPAVKATGNASVSAPSVGVVGSVTTTGRARVENLTTGIDPITDPLDGLPVPVLPRPPDVPSVVVSGQTQRTISPGVYKEITVTGRGVLTLTPGTYVILGGFSATGNGAVTGDGVSLYLACSSYPAACAPGTNG